jgi:hypothetical protein
MVSYNDYAMLMTYRLREQELIKQAEENRIINAKEEEPVQRRRSVRINNN